MDEIHAHDQQSSVESSQSYHHFHLLESQLQRLEQRVHKLYKSQKNTQKMLDSHMLDQSTQRQSMLKWLNQLTSRFGDDSNLKSIKQKFQSQKPQSTQVLEHKLSQLRAEFKKEMKSQSVSLKEEISRVGKLGNQLQDVKDLISDLVEDQSNVKKKIQKSTEDLETKFNKSIEDGMNSIQQIIRTYINDQAGIVIKIKNIEEQLKEFNRGPTRQILQLTPRDIVPNATPILPRNSLKSSSKYQTSNQKKSNSKQAYGTATDRSKDKHALAERPSTLERESSIKNMSAFSEKQRQRSYSSKKITDLREKLKQFQIINTKYKGGQHSADENYMDEEVVGSRTSNASKPAKEAIQQLKQFKYMLENTESQMDISNTFNHQMMPKKTDSQPKYKKLDKVYHN